MHLRALIELEPAGRIEDILAELGPAPPESLPAEAALLAGRCLLRRPDPAGAIPYLRRAALPEAPPATAIEAHRALARLHRGLGQEVIAVGHLRALLALRPAERDPRFRLAEALHRLGWQADALREMAALRAPVSGWWRGAEDNMRKARNAARRQALRLLARREEGRRVALPRGARLVMLIRWLLASGRGRAAVGLAARGAAEPGAGPRIRLANLEMRLYQEGAHANLALRLPPPGSDDEVMVEAARLALHLDAPMQVLEALSRVPRLDEPAAALRARALIRLGRHGELAMRAAAELGGSPGSAQAARHALTGWILTGALVPCREDPPLAAAAVAAMPLLQFWHAPEPPADVAAVMASWPRHHPSLRPARFDATTARAWLVTEAGTRIAELFDLCRHPAMQADLFRLVFLHRHGGLYVDADEECLRPNPALLAQGAALGLAAPYLQDLPYYLNNNLLLAAPGSPVLARAIALVCEGLAQATGARPSIWHTTGPGALTRAVAGHLASENAAPVLPLCPRYLEQFSRTVDTLAYKRAPGGDWRQA